MSRFIKLIVAFAIPLLLTVLAARLKQQQKAMEAQQTEECMIREATAVEVQWDIMEAFFQMYKLVVSALVPL